MINNHGENCLLKQQMTKNNHGEPVRGAHVTGRPPFGACRASSCTAVDALRWVETSKVTPNNSKGPLSKGGGSHRSPPSTIEDLMKTLVKTLVKTL